MRALPTWLLVLTLAAFTVQTDDFIVIGVLPALASDVGVSETAAGQLVTVYSLVYALTAPLWAVLLARFPPRGILPVALAVFTLANLAVMWVQGFGALMALRVVAALAAAVVLPAALAAAATRAPEEHRGRYLATVMTGLTGAILLGVPAGTWIGAAFGWRATFVFCGLLGALALVLAARSLPRPGAAARGTPGAGSGQDQPLTGRAVSEIGPPSGEPKTGSEAHGAEGPGHQGRSSSSAEETGSGAVTGVRAGLRASLRPLLNRAVVGLLVVTVLVVAGNLAFQTYLAPFLAGLAGVGPHQLAALLVASGIGGVAGTRYAGRMVDRVGARSAFGLVCGAFCLTMAAFALLWLAAPVPVWAAAALLVCWSATAWAVPTTVQALTLARVGQRAATQAVAVLSSAVYVGAALGGVVGGLAVAAGTGLVPAAATLFAVSGLVLALLVTRAKVR
ncbi:MFS transporter [Nocardiopsis exhalans]|uniref:MFS transporter n=1 Tax=Nocardiopsis exhalans TaxID=163604 RepID=A0ABY5D354_9ACTN|nr:MFS transporter [Nocardiopsis exhalans]USY18457.1 MFS transporter [Nocardiopsis exhalans]